MRTALRSQSVRTIAITQFLLEVQFWFPVWLIYLLDLGFSLTTAVLADVIFRIVAVVCEFPVGVVADLVGRRRTYLALAGGTVLTFAAITQIRTVQVLFGVWALWGLLWALTSGAASTYLYELCAQDELDVEPAKAFGLVRALGNGSMLLSLLAAGYLYEMSPRLPFAITAALAMVALLLAFTLPEIKEPRMVSTLSSVLSGIKDAAANRRIRQVASLGVLLLLFGWSARILFQPLSMELSLSTQVTGWMYATFAAASAFGGLVAGYVRPPHRPYALVMAFGLVLAALVATSQLARLGPFVFLPFMGFGYILGMTVLEVITNEVTPGKVRAMTFGAITCIGGVGIAVARPALGLLAEHYSASFAFGMWAWAGLVLVGLATRKISQLRPAL